MPSTPKKSSKKLLKKTAMPDPNEMAMNAIPPKRKPPTKKKAKKA